MLALAIDLLIAIAAVAGALSLADSAFKARRAYRGLMRENALMDAGLMLPAGARPMRRPGDPRRAGAVMPVRRPALWQPQPVLVRGAA